MRNEWKIPKIVCENCEKFYMKIVRKKWASHIQIRPSLQVSHRILNLESVKNLSSASQKKLTTISLVIFTWLILIFFTDFKFKIRWEIGYYYFF